jgi:hypothetical protein
MALLSWLLKRVQSVHSLVSSLSAAGAPCSRQSLRALCRKLLWAAMTASTLGAAASAACRERQPGSSTSTVAQKLRLRRPLRPLQLWWAVQHTLTLRSACLSAKSCLNSRLYCAREASLSTREAGQGTLALRLSRL